MFCTHCGNQLREGALFCPSCGRALGIAGAAAAAPHPGVAAGQRKSNGASQRYCFCYRYLLSP